jgi:hypothetical protein
VAKRSTCRWSMRGGRDAGPAVFQHERTAGRRRYPHKDCVVLVPVTDFTGRGPRRDWSRAVRSVGGQSSRPLPKQKRRPLSLSHGRAPRIMVASHLRAQKENWKRHPAAGLLCSSRPSSALLLTSSLEGPVSKRSKKLCVPDGLT